jgi:hypothetical protein
LHPENGSASLALGEVQLALELLHDHLGAGEAHANGVILDILHILFHFQLQKWDKQVLLLLFIDSFT